LLLLLGDGWIIVKEKLSRDSFDPDYLICNKWKPLNVITLGLRENNNINQMITITGFYIESYCNIEQIDHSQSDPNKWLITFTIIALSGFHYIESQCHFCILTLV
jgi:hypothetical protein